MKDYVVYSDESRHTEGRYRSLAAVSLPAVERVAFAERISEEIQFERRGELKWKNVKGAINRKRAIAVIDVLFAHLASGVRVDVLTWDTHDRRHDVRNRDDVANYERMFYHLHCKLMERRGAQSRWHIFPDEQVSIDWPKIWQCLNSEGTWLSGRNIASLSSEFLHSIPCVPEFREVNSEESPICQLADLMAGMAAYTHTNANMVRRQLTAPAGQRSLFETDDERTPSNTDKNRFQVVAHLYQECKERKLGLSLTERGYLWSPFPGKPINFWDYEPQHPYDKAPIRRMRSGLKRPR